ncbi:Heavy metal-associated isoprenylated plant protein 26 [Spatholobus suberectus]|nr:Heavy metal-associated isoprenylated plant protein 26 [Spatholobus suberectus]
MMMMLISYSKFKKAKQYKSNIFCSEIGLSSSRQLINKAFRQSPILIRKTKECLATDVALHHLWRVREEENLNPYLVCYCLMQCLRMSTIQMFSVAKFCRTRLYQSKRPNETKVKETKQCSCKVFETTYLGGSTGPTIHLNEKVDKMVIGTFSMMRNVWFDGDGIAWVLVRPSTEASSQSYKSTYDSEVITQQLHCTNLAFVFGVPTPSFICQVHKLVPASLWHMSLYERKPIPSDKDLTSVLIATVQHRIGVLNAKKLSNLDCTRSSSLTIFLNDPANAVDWEGSILPSRKNCILKVNIHCDGCEQKVKKILQKIEGVYSVNIDAERGKVMVSGHVDPAKLIKKLKRSGKHAELWGGQRGMMYNQNYPTYPQFKNLHIDNTKGAKDNKSQNHKGGGQKGGGGGGGGGGGQLAHFQNTKGGSKVPPKNQKSVNFNLSEDELDESDGDFDEFDDYDDEFEDDFDEEDEEEEYGHGHGHGHGHVTMARGILCNITR